MKILPFLCSLNEVFQRGILDFRKSSNNGWQSTSESQRDMKEDNAEVVQKKTQTPSKSSNKTAKDSVMQNTKFDGFTKI